ncbi:hypothetical protein B0E38_04484 [Streptomyces sp. 111WW2]|nr:hypothetical protein B0E38_04484 [Streptomyces sp. 111WW2]
MSMSVRCEGGGLPVPATPPGCSPAHATPCTAPYLRKLAQVPRFHRAARGLLTRTPTRPSRSAGSWTARASHRTSAPTS